MKTHEKRSGRQQIVARAAAGLAAVMLTGSAAPATAQVLTLANPHWNITLTDAGYSDFLLDNTPGFEGREYLSGEWGGAVGYQRSAGQGMAPQWLEPHFVFPDWATLSPFHVVNPLAQAGINADNLPIAQSVIANGDLQITLRHEMLDTVVGIPMGTAPASSTNPPNAVLLSSRYVLKQTATLKNISGGSLTAVQFFQFLHGLWSQRGVYDNRAYSGVLSNFQHDITLAGVDPNAVGAGSSTNGLEDFMSLQASRAPGAFEVGYYGIDGNGIDAHSLGKPSDGVHLSVENNWQTAPYSTRNGTDYFAPGRLWVAGAQRWDLGDLAANQSVSLDILLSLLTGTRVSTGTGSSGGCNGGSGVPGGTDYSFDDVTSPGSCFGEYSQADAGELSIRIDEGEFGPLNFMTPGGRTQIWKLQFSGAYGGTVHLVFGYDPTILPPQFDENSLCLYQAGGATWHPLASTVDPLAHTITVTTSHLGPFALGVETSTPVQIVASVLPPNSGTLAGAGAYAPGALASLVAAPLAGYAFTNWTEGAAVISTSPSYTFTAQSNRVLVANFVPVGTGVVISTRSTPASGGTTSGDGAYAPGSTATVAAFPNPGYKFSKWLENGVVVSLSPTNSFTVTTSRTLEAKFKPVYAVTVTPQPANGGELEADPFYEMNELAKLKAKPFAGFSFLHWTQNGVVVSTDPNFQFYVTGNRDLVGHFAPGNRIDLLAEPVNGGTVAGAGVWPSGATVLVEAEAKPGYVFVGWNEGAQQVSSSAAYSFASTASRSLVANFVAQPVLLGAISAPGELTLSWPASATGWSLQESGELRGAAFTNSTRTVTQIGGRNQVLVPPGSPTTFFRLMHP